MMRDYVLLYVNGRPVEVRGLKTKMMLSDFLRYELGLVGTKIVCAEGDCGACTVLKWNPLTEKNKFFVPVNSCIGSVGQSDGTSLVTVEALAKNSELSEVQKSMLSCHASQCGFCTPGFVMALTGLSEKLLAEKRHITKSLAKNYLTGNLCRCTGYEAILESACKINLNSHPLKKEYLASAQIQHLKSTMKKPLYIKDDNFIFFAPTTLKQASDFLKKNKRAKLLGGGTDLGVLINKGRFDPTVLLSLHLIAELFTIEKSKAGDFKIGARVTLSEVRRSCEKEVPEFAKFLDIFASLQIKNMATLAGNVANASPIADTPPFLLTMEATQIVYGPNGRREIPMDKFYKSYKKTTLKEGEFIAFTEFSIPMKSEKLRLYKSSQRKDLDISCVNAAFRMVVDKKNKIRKIFIAFGGVAETPLRLKRLEKYFLGKSPNLETLQAATPHLHREIRPIDDLRGSSSFRRITAENFLEKFFKDEGYVEQQ